MKITFVIPFASLAGGIRVVATYAQVLVDLGHEVTVISAPHPTSPKRLKSILKQALKRLLGQSDTALRPSTPLLDFLGDRHIILDSDRAVTAQDITDGDAVIATWWKTAAGVAALPASKGAGFYLLQDYEVFGPCDVDQVARTYALPLKKIAVSRYIKDCVSNNHGGADITVIPNAVDIAQFDAPVRGRSPSITVGFLYQKPRRKRVELAIATVRRARAQMPDLRVIVFGQSDPGAEFDFPDWIDYHRAPAQNAIPGLYASCDAWLFTSESEGFGLPILEAMACRTPVLATDAGAARDLIDGTNGQIVAPTADAFADAILGLGTMTDADWLAMSQAAYQTAQSYTWMDATHKLLETIKAQRAA